MDVTDAIQADFDAEGTTGLTQFRLQFTSDSDFDGELDRVQVKPWSCEVDYLTP